jgi:hypothetical protein
MKWLGSSNPKPLLKVGDVVRVKRDCRGVQHHVNILYYRRNTFARLVRETTHGWFCDFRGLGNPDGTYRCNQIDPSEAEWFVSRNAMEAV